MTMEARFAEAHGILEQIGVLFGQLEQHIGHPDEVAIEDTIKKKLEGLTGTFDKLEVYVLKEHPSKRQASRLRLNQMKYDATHLHSSLSSFQTKRFRRERERTDREDLLSRRFTTNENPGPSNRFGGNENTSISIDQSIHHHSALQNAHRGIDDILAQGYHILGNLQDQKSILKRTKTRLLNFTNTLGLSNTVMQFIERRAYQDKFVLYGGMIVTLSIIFFIYLYFT